MMDLLIILPKLSLAIRFAYSIGSSGECWRPSNSSQSRLMRAVGDYIFMFDSDDILLPEKLDMSIAAVDSHPDINLFLIY